MATSGSSSVAVTAYDTLKFSWSQVSQNVANNTTTISWTLQLIASAHGYIASSASKAWSVTVNGTNYSGTNTVSIANNATKTLASGSTTITHNADGTKSFSYSFSQTFDITFSDAWVGTKSGSGSGTLNTIARATTPTLSASSVDMGGTVTINTPRASSSFTHDLAYSFAGSSYTSIATGVATSYSWTVADVASRIPNATSGTMTIRCITKNGSTTIGTKTVLLTVKVPASVVPTISSVTLSEATSGLAAKFGVYVQNKSTVKAAITAAGAKGSTIKTYSTKFQGKTYTGASWTSGLLASSGSLSMTTTVTDSRGRTAKKTTTLTVQAYMAPQIKRLSVYRCDASGVAQNGGEYIALDCWYEVTGLGNKNTASAVFDYKADAASESEYATLHTLTSLAHNAKIFPTGTTFSPDSMYDIRLTVTDWFGAEAKATAVALLPTEAVILDIKANGKGIAFGKVAELDGFDTGFQTRHTGGLRPMVLDPDTDLNDVRTPNTYTGENITNYKYLNCPVTSGTFTLIVESGGESGQVCQTFKTCSKYKPEKFVRWYYQGEWGDWCWANTDEYILYESAEGSAGTITFDASASHYRYIEIYFTDNNGKKGGYTKVYQPNGAVVCLHIQETGTTIYSRQTEYTISGTTMTPNVTTASYVRFSGTALSISAGTNYIKIVRVIGRA